PCRGWLGLFVRHTVLVCTAYLFSCQAKLCSDRMTAPGDDSATPRHAARATRTAGRQRRSQLLDAASELFAERGLGDVSLAEIADRADTFPSQVTYYFGSKEALFVEAACREVLRAAEEVERAGARARTPGSYVRAI